MTARKTFQKLGYQLTKLYAYKQVEPSTLVYTRTVKNFKRQIIFYLNYKEIMYVNCVDTKRDIHRPFILQRKEIEAVNLQQKELGWLK